MIEDSRRIKKEYKEAKQMYCNTRDTLHQIIYEQKMEDERLEAEIYMLHNEFEIKKNINNEIMSQLATKNSIFARIIDAVKGIASKISINDGDVISQHDNIKTKDQLAESLEALELIERKIRCQENTTSRSSTSRTRWSTSRKRVTIMADPKQHEKNSDIENDDYTNLKTDLCRVSLPSSNQTQTEAWDNDKQKSNIASQRIIVSDSEDDDHYVTRDSLKRALFSKRKSKP